MVERQLRARGIDDERVLAAMRRVPRELFVPEAERMHAYDDVALPIGYEQTIEFHQTIETGEAIAVDHRSDPTIPGGGRAAPDPAQAPLPSVAAQGRRLRKRAGPRARRVLVCGR